MYTPGRFVVGIFRLGAEPGTAEVLLARLAAGLQSQLLAGVATSSATDLERGVSPPSFSAIRRLLALCTDCPLAMVALRTRAVDRGLFRFAFVCELQASRLVAADAARVPVCAQAQRGRWSSRSLFALDACAGAPAGDSGRRRSRRGVPAN